MQLNTEENTFILKKRGQKYLDVYLLLQRHLISISYTKQGKAFSTERKASSKTLKGENPRDTSMIYFYIIDIYVNRNILLFLKNVFLFHNDKVKRNVCPIVLIKDETLKNI